MQHHQSFYSCLGVDEGEDASATRVIRFLSFHLPNIHYSIFNHNGGEKGVHYYWKNILKQHNDTIRDGIIFHYVGSITLHSRSSSSPRTLMSSTLTVAKNMINKRLYDDRQYMLWPLGVSVESVYDDLRVFSRQVLVLDLVHRGSSVEGRMLASKLGSFFSTKQNVVVLGCVTTSKGGVFSRKISDPVDMYLKEMHPRDVMSESGDSVVDGFLFLNDTSKAKIFRVIMANLEELFLQLYPNWHYLINDLPIFQLVLSMMILVKYNTDSSSLYFSVPDLSLGIIHSNSSEQIWQRLEMQVEQIIITCRENRTTMVNKFIQLRNKL